MNKAIIQILIGFMLIVGLQISSPLNVNANSYAGPGFGTIGLTCGSNDDRDNCGSDVNILQIVSGAGTIDMHVYSRPFNFIRSDNRGNLASNDWVPIGTNLTYTNVAGGVASGSWWKTGGYNDTPYLGTGWHNIGGGRAGNGSVNVGAPTTSDPSSVTGGGAVSCNGWNCRANSVGSASITVNFPGGTVPAKSAPKYPDQSDKCPKSETKTTSYPAETRSTSFTCRDGESTSTRSGGRCYPTGRGNVSCIGSKYTCPAGTITEVVPIQRDCGEDNENIGYGAQSLTYYFNVYQPDTKPTINPITVSDINYTTAKVNWKYSDTEGDAQTWWNVQVSTDSGFSNIVVFNGDYGTVTNSIVNNLQANTTYYTRVRAGNAKTATGDSNPLLADKDKYWVNGSSFKTRAYPQASINFNVEDTGGATGITQDGDPLRFTWSITNPAGVASCSASTAGGTNVGNSIWAGNKSVSDVSNTENTILPFSQLNRVYDFTINCIPKVGGNTIKPVTVRLNTVGRESIVTLTSSTNRELKQGDSVNLSRTIVNREVLTGCKNTVTGGAVAAGGNFISDTTTNDILAATEKIDPNLRTNTTYVFTSTCSPIDGPIRSSSVTVIVKPKPIISCDLDNKVVAENNNIIKLNLIGDSAWVGPYEWKVKRGIGNDLRYSNTTLNKMVDLNYSDAVLLGIGKYDIKAQLNAGGIDSEEVTCGSISSLGNRSIKEVAP